MVDSSHVLDIRSVKIRNLLTKLRAWVSSVLSARRERLLRRGLDEVNSFTAVLNTPNVISPLGINQWKNPALIVEVKSWWKR